MCDAFLGTYTSGYALALDPGTAAVISGVIGAGGNVAGGLLASGGDGQDLEDSVLISGLDLRSDPAINAATLLALESAGLPIEQALSEASPHGRAISVINASPLTPSQKERNIGTLGRVLFGTPSENIKGGDQARFQINVLTPLGYGSNEEFRQAQADYDVRAEQIITETGPVIEEVRAGRLSALEGISSILQDFPLATETDIQRTERQVRARQGQRFDDLRAQLLQQANVGGFNPAHGLGEIAREQENADLDALQTAIALMAGRQGLATSGLQTLQTAIGVPEQQLAQVGNLRGGVAAQQMLALNAPGQGAVDAARAANLGQGVTGATDILAGTVSSLGQLAFVQDLIRQIQSGGPGTGNTGASTSSGSSTIFPVGFGTVLAPG